MMDFDRVQDSSIELAAYPKNIGRFLRRQHGLYAHQKMVQERLRSHQDPNHPFSSLTWEDGWKHIQGIALFLEKQGVEKGDRIAFLSENRSEMFLSFLACHLMGALSVPIYDGYAPAQIADIFENAQPKLLMVSNRAQLESCFEKTTLETCPAVVVFDQDDQGLSTSLALTVTDFAEITPCYASEDQLQTWFDSVGPQDSCMIMYTSGTTGKPKGVELTHQNILSQHQGIKQFWDIQSEDRFLCYLPWHHCFGGIFEIFLALHHGVTLTIDDSRGKDLKRLMENWSLIRPTLFFSVPMIYQYLLAEAKQNPEWERDFFHSELRWVFTAAAPLSPKVYQEFMKRGIPVQEGWGLTEASPGITMTRPEKETPSGCVGEVMPGIRIAFDEKGQIYAQGPNIMKGYFRNPKETSKVLNDEGWLATGDLGRWQDEGLEIIGRMDGVFKLMNGEKIPSEPVESVLLSEVEFLSRVLVLGRGKEYVVAILFLDRNAVQEKYPKLLQDPELKHQLKHMIKTANQKMDTKYFRVRKVFLDFDNLSIESGEVTPTQKICRPNVEKRYQSQIQEMYYGSPDFQLDSYILI